VAWRRQLEGTKGVGPRGCMQLERNDDADDDAALSLSFAWPLTWSFELPPDEGLGDVGE
jgi:hypothetical protein